jgi:hypothetical protein
VSERVISDPTVAGWELNPDTGYWMWAAGSGGGGSIQDGDTEGQITTWSGDEWAPEGAVVAGDGNLSVTSSTDTATIDLNNSVGNYEIANNEYGSIAINYNGDERFVLASNGDVYVQGRLFVSGQEVTAGGGASLWVEESPGVIKYTGTAKATTLIGTG